MNTENLRDTHGADERAQMNASARIRVLSGLHAGAVMVLAAPSRSLGPDVADDMILLDARDGRLTFDFDPMQGWFVTPENGLLTLDGTEVQLYEQVELTAPRSLLAINNVQLEFVYNEARPGDALAAGEERTTQSPVSASTRDLLKTRHTVGVYAGVALCAAAAALLALTILTRGEDSAASARSFDDARVVAAVVAPKKQSADRNATVRQQAADYLNAFRLPISIVSVSDIKIDLAWSGADALPPQIKRQIGPVLFGRMVEWSDTAEPVTVSDASASGSARQLRLNPNRGNRHTEDTLRGYGLMDIASVSALDANPRFVLTRAGHRIYEGSELKNGAKLAAVSATELMVQANGSIWMVPYDVSKPVRRVANSFTAAAQNPTQEPVFPQEVSSNDAQSVNVGVAGTPIAVVSMPRGKDTESELAGQSK
jgi:hypothetical protein